MHTDEFDDLLKKGIEAAEKGYIPTAQIILEQVIEQRNIPEAHTYLAYCLAKGQGRINSAAKICRESIKREPENSLHYLILGRILLMVDDRHRAIATFRRGLKRSPSPKIIAELKMLGLRKTPIITTLDRKHPANRILGRAANLLRLR